MHVQVVSLVCRVLKCFLMFVFCLTRRLSRMHVMMQPHRNKALLECADLARASQCGAKARLLLLQ